MKCIEYKAPSLTAGDRVIITPTRPNQKEQVARVVKRKGDHLLVRQRDGTKQWLYFCRVRYEPTPRTLQKRLDDVRRSWEDDQLRAKLNLPQRQIRERHHFHA